MCDAPPPPAREASLRAFTRAGAALLLIVAATAIAADPPPSFSARLDALWEFGRPAESEARLRAELAMHPAGSREALETSTQIARTQSLRRQFAAADATLDAIAPELDGAPPRVRVRYLHERGRTRNSAGDKPAAVTLFTAALDACARGDAKGAAQWAAKAHALLKDDPSLAAREAPRLARLADVAQGAAR